MCPYVLKCLAVFVILVFFSADAVYAYMDYYFLNALPVSSRKVETHSPTYIYLTSVSSNILLTYIVLLSGVVDDTLASHL